MEEGAEISSIHDVEYDNTIHRFIKKKTLGEIIARCAAEDGFSFHSISQSEAIRENVSNRGFSMPNSQSTVKKLFDQFCFSAKDEVRRKLNDLKCEGLRFSATVDEWTNIRNARFLSVTLHCTTYNFCLGLIKIEGKADSENILNLFK